MRTPLHDAHASAGARMVDFAGWRMPLHYGRIADEHAAVRSRAGVFDVSHMGRILARGRAALEHLDRLLSIHVLRLRPGRAKYGFLLNASGGIHDDLIVYREEQDALIVCNAANTRKVWDVLEGERPAGAHIEPVTEQIALVAVQGPKAAEIVATITGLAVQEIRFYGFIRADFAGDSRIARTGYTGEDGFELFIPAERAIGIWERLLKTGAPHGLLPCGLGARDTLRTEAGMPLYGHEIDETTHPFEAGLDFGVAMDKPMFRGREALERIRAEPPRRRLVGFEVPSGRTPRPGQPVLDSSGRPCGKVTSGTFGFTVGKAIGMAYVDSAGIAAGDLSVELRPGRCEPIRIVGLPFYRRPR
jgi:aminomethyltransferase